MQSIINAGGGCLDICFSTQCGVHSLAKVFISLRGLMNIN